MPLDPEAKTVLETLSGGEEVDPFSLPHTVVREGFAAMSGLVEGPEVSKVEMRELDGPAGKISVRIYSPAGDGPKPGLVFFHGGGFVVCDLDSHDATCRELANGADCVVVSVEGLVGTQECVLCDLLRRFVTMGQSAGPRVNAWLILANEHREPDITIRDQGALDFGFVCRIARFHTL